MNEERNLQSALLSLGLSEHNRAGRLIGSDTADPPDMIFIDHAFPEHRIICMLPLQHDHVRDLAMVRTPRLPDMLIVQDRLDHALPTALIRAFLEDEDRQRRQQLPLEVVLRSFDHIHMDTGPNLKPNRADRRSAKHHRRKPQIDHRLKSLRKR